MPCQHRAELGKRCKEVKVIWGGVLYCLIQIEESANPYRYPSIASRQPVS